MYGGDNDDGQELTSEECVRAGMYWFGRSDFTAADAWWQRALELDPGNTRAHECLRLLSKTSQSPLSSPTPAPVSRPTSYPKAITDDLTDYSSDLSADLPSSGSMDLEYYRFGPESSSEDMAVLTAGEDGEPSAPMAAHGPPSMVLDQTGDLRTDTHAKTPSRDLPPVSDRPHGTEFPFYDDPDPDRPQPTDPFDFAATGQQPKAPSGPPSGLAGIYASPWDEGPSRTSVVTLDTNSNEYDAVPTPTPLPAIDRERFFGREAPETHEEIMDYLRETGDLPGASSSNKSGGGSDDDGPGILIDDPVEFPEQNRPSGSASLASPSKALAEGRRRYQLHDFQGALDALEEISADSPEHTEARNLIASSRQQMLRMYESKIGDFDQIPEVLISNEEVIWLNLNHRAGFILSQIDGAVTYDDIIALSGMPRLDTVRILSELIGDKVIGVK